MRKNLLIDLTPLLDVVLILLFLIVASAGTRAGLDRERVDEAGRRAKEAELAARQTEEELAGLRGRLAAADRFETLDGAALSQYQAFEEQVAKLDLLCGRAGDKCLLTLTDSRGAVRELAIAVTDIRSAKTAELTALLREALSACGSGPVVLSVRYDNRVLHRFEYIIITDAIGAVRAETGDRLLVSETQLAGAAEATEEAENAAGTPQAGGW